MNRKWSSFHFVPYDHSPENKQQWWDSQKIFIVRILTWAMSRSRQEQYVIAWAEDFDTDRQERVPDFINWWWGSMLDQVCVDQKLPFASHFYSEAFPFIHPSMESDGPGSPIIDFKQFRMYGYKSRTHPSFRFPITSCSLFHPCTTSWIIYAISCTTLAKLVISALL